MNVGSVKPFGARLLQKCSWFELEEKKEKELECLK